MNNVLELYNLIKERTENLNFKLIMDYDRFKKQFDCFIHFEKSSIFKDYEDGYNFKMYKNLYIYFTVDMLDYLASILREPHNFKNFLNLCKNETINKYPELFIEKGLI